MSPFQVPQEEVPKYESKGKLWAKDQATYPVGMAPELFGAEQSSIPGLTVEPKKKKSTSGSHSQSSTAAASSSTTSKKDSSKPDSPLADIEKKLKSCHKKLREIEQLQAKIDSGQLPNPEKNQLEKLAKRNDLETEISNLEETLDRFKISG